jgi:hypothetical protein
VRVLGGRKTTTNVQAASAGPSCQGSLLASVAATAVVARQCHLFEVLYFFLNLWLRRFLLVARPAIKPPSCGPYKKKKKKTEKRVWAGECILSERSRISSSKAARSTRGSYLYVRAPALTRGRKAKLRLANGEDEEEEESVEEAGRQAGRRWGWPMSGALLGDPVGLFRCFSCRQVETCL